MSLFLGNAHRGTQGLLSFQYLLSPPHMEAHNSNDLRHLAIPCVGWPKLGGSSAHEEAAGVARLAAFSGELGWAITLQMASLLCLGWLGQLGAAGPHLLHGLCLSIHRRV